MNVRDEEFLQGAWEVAEVLGLEGEEAEDAARTGFWFQGDRLVTGDEEAAWEWPYRLEVAEGGTKRLVTWSPDPNFSYSPKGVYAINGKDILLCYSVDETNPYPSTVEPSEDQVVLRLVRSTRPVPA